MKEPPVWLMDFLENTETVALEVKEDFSEMNDKDAEWVYGKLADYYKAVGRGKKVPEPVSTIERRQALIDEILNMTDEREESGLDIDNINNPECTLNGKPITALGFYYFHAFNRLESSAAFWRKNREFGGYFGYISRFI